MVDPKSELSDEGRSKEPTASDIDAGAEKRPGIFVRINPGAKEVLEGAAKGSSYGKVIERLLEYFHDQSPEFKDKILRGAHISPLRDSQDLIARLHRAQHAFENKRFYLAIETYLLVANSLKKDSSEDLLEVCHYRIAHCLIRWSYELRAEALSHRTSATSSSESLSKCSDDFSLALKVLDVALGFLDKVRTHGDSFTTLISHYNKACCYALKAQYMVESQLDLLDRGTLHTAAVNNDKTTTQNLWKDIGGRWRDINHDLTPDQLAHEALRELNMVYSNKSTDDSPSSETSGLTSEQVWLVEISKNDDDLTFMRWDNVWQQKFNDWRNSLQKNTSMKAVEPMLQRCSQLLNRL